MYSRVRFCRWRQALGGPRGGAAAAGALAVVLAVLLALGVAGAFPAGGAGAVRRGRPGPGRWPLRAGGG